MGTIKSMLVETLIIDLNEAERIVSKLSGGYSGEFLSAEEFHNELLLSILELKKGNMNVIRTLWFWFLPTSVWDDFVGNNELGNRIFSKLEKLKISNQLF